ncbi:MAG: hypothetical protein ABDI07_11270 [Candidatus Kryptonium sp.]
MMKKIKLSLGCEFFISREDKEEFIKSHISYYYIVRTNHLREDKSFLVMAYPGWTIDVNSHTIKRDSEKMILTFNRDLNLLGFSPIFPNLYIVPANTKHLYATQTDKRLYFLADTYKISLNLEEKNMYVETYPIE